jgi:hypothetical protein
LRKSIRNYERGNRTAERETERVPIEMLAAPTMAPWGGGEVEATTAR